MPADINRLDEAHYRRLRRRASAKRRIANNGQRLRAEAADRERRADFDAQLDQILAAGTPELDAELARLENL